MITLVAQYRGVSVLSRAIRAVNWGPYSHSSHITADATEIEAWRKGVTETPGLGVNHTPRTKVDLFLCEPPPWTVATSVPDWRRNLDRYAREHLGWGYDYWGLLGFLARSPRLQRGNRMFCSELVSTIYDRAGLPLLSRIPPYKVHPTLLSYSPRLTLLASNVLTPLTPTDLTATIAPLLPRAETP